MRYLLVLLCSPLFVAAALWSLQAACIDTPPEPGPVVARVVAAWDPLACGAPHRVVLELEDDIGEPRSASMPCNLGSLTLDVPHLGRYQGRIYAWALDAPVRSAMPVEVMVDQPIVHWFVETPP
jgi:hypothetical protein